MLANKHIKQLIREQRHYEIGDYLKTKEARDEGMFAMDDVIFDKYRKGVIEEEVALIAAFDRKEMQKAIDELKSKKVVKK